MSQKVQGVDVTPIRLGKNEYITVADRSRVAHETTDEHKMGYQIIDERFFDLKGRYFVTVTIQVDDKRFMGTSEIRFDATSGADKTSPIECAETSAVGRALGFAGFGVLDGIASYDEVKRATDAEGNISTRPANATPRPAQSAREAADAEAHGGIVTLGKIRMLLNSRGVKTMRDMDAWLGQHTKAGVKEEYTAQEYASILATLDSQGAKAS